MRIALFTTGSRGDVQPFLALGRRLLENGHQVLLATHESFRSVCEKEELTFAPLPGDPYEFLHSAEGANFIGKQGVQAFSSGIKILRLGLEPITLDAKRACENFGAELCLWNLPTIMVDSVARSLNIPSIGVGLQPVTPTVEFTHSMLPPPRYSIRWLNRISYSLMFGLGWTILGQEINRCRTQLLGLPSLNSKEFSQLEKRKFCLYAFSESLVARPYDWPENVQITGYWFKEALGEVLDVRLKQFLDGGSPPVVFGFGSMVTGDPVIRARTVVQAVQKAGVRAVLLTGWGGMVPEDLLPEQIFATQFAPHDCLLPHAAAFCHHGGAGTTAAAMKAGIPSIICPFSVDQHFWGQYAWRKQIATEPLPQQKLSVEALAQAIRVACNNQGMNERSRQISESVRREDGLGNAVMILNRWIEKKKLPSQFSV